MATKVVFLDDPSTGVDGEQGVSVAVEGPDGRPVLGAEVEVVLIVFPSGACDLSSALKPRRLTAMTKDGVAVFKDLKAKAGDKLCLAIDTSTSGLTAPPPMVTTLRPPTLAFTRQPPAQVKAGQTFAAQLTAQGLDPAPATAGVSVMKDAACSVVADPLAKSTVVALPAAPAAASGTWTLTLAGSYALKATLDGATPACSAAIAVTPGDGRRLIAATGTTQTGFTGGRLPSDPVVAVTDEFGNPVAGVTVSFAVTAGGGSLAAASVVSGTDGRAAPAWTLGPARGANKLSATIGSGALAVTLELTATALDPVCDVAAIAGSFQAGSGTVADPFLICTPAQLNAVGASAASMDKAFRVMQDIDMSAYDGSTVGKTFVMIGTSALPFTGVFDGNAKVIDHVLISATTDQSGFFGSVKGAQISHLRLPAVAVTVAGPGLNRLALVAGNVENSSFADVQVTGTMQGPGTGYHLSGGFYGTMLVSGAGIQAALTDVTVAATLNDAGDDVGGLGSNLTVTGGGQLTIARTRVGITMATISGNTFGGLMSLAGVSGGGALNIADTIVTGSLNVATAGSWSGAFIGTFNVDGAGSQMNVTRSGCSVSLADPTTFFVTTGASGGFFGTLTVSNGAVMAVNRSFFSGVVHGSGTAVATSNHGDFAGQANIDTGGSLTLTDLALTGAEVFDGAQGHSRISGGFGQITVNAPSTLTLTRVLATASVTGSNLSTVGGVFGYTNNAASIGGTVTLSHVLYNSTLLGPGVGDHADLVGMTGVATAGLQSAATYDATWNAAWQVADGAYPKLVGVPSP